MKKIYRRSISGLMALLICFTTILGGGITAFAASSSGEVAKSYSIGFPRSGDANLDYSGTWGHDELHYMNGWTSGEATWMTTLHTIGSFDGPACYCIEPGFPVCWRKPIQDTARIIGRTIHLITTVRLMPIPSRHCWAESCSMAIRVTCPSTGAHRMKPMPTKWRT